MKKDACRFSSRVMNQGAKVILAYDVKKRPAEGWEGTPIRIDFTVLIRKDVT
jgi:hypothetical protein